MWGSVTPSQAGDTFKAQGQKAEVRALLIQSYWQLWGIDLRTGSKSKGSGEVLGPPVGCGFGGDVSAAKCCHQGF